MPTTAQTQALAHLAARALAARPTARATIAAILARSALLPSALDDLLPALLDRTKVTLSFHPDRLCADGATVAERLRRDGHYRSQFETGVTNGSPTAFAGGERDGWEASLFGSAYQSPTTTPDERPKYGALNLMHHPDGGSPRFGSCYFELRPHVSARCTLTWGDSHEGPEHVGTRDLFEPIAAALLQSVETTRHALGVADLDITALLDRLASSHRSPAPRPSGRALDAYIEAQVHGRVDLATDVEALVIDPSFDETPTGMHLQALAARYGLALRRHPGFVLATSEVPDDFRGPRMPALAERVAAFSLSTRALSSHPIDAATLGQAAASLHRDPQSWSDWAPPAETWQHLKQLWHVLVRFGHPHLPSSSPPPESPPR